jgi:hypothetical protein
MPLVVISVLFGLSLFAAWVLFKILRSTATVSKPEYQLGGAAAGFVVILTILSVTYIQVDDKKKQDSIRELTTELDHTRVAAAAGKACLDEQRKEVTYSGTVSPSLPDANVILGVSEVKLQKDGKFAIKVHYVKPSDLPSIYVIGANSHAPYKQVFATDDPENLMIPR